MANTTPTAQRPAEMDATSSAAPVAAFRFESISAAVFTDSVNLKDGKSADVFHVSLRRAYRTADGKWQHTNVLRPADLLAASLALLKSYEFCQQARANRDEEPA